MQDDPESKALAWIGRSLDENPIARLLGARPISCDPMHGRFVASFEARPEFCNLLGSIQGGMLTAMLDLAMAFAVLCTLDSEHVVPSLEIKTNFLSPARPGPLLGSGTLVRRGRVIAFMEGRLTNATGEILTTATATGQIRARPPRSAALQREAAT